MSRERHSLLSVLTPRVLETAILSAFHCFSVRKEKPVVSKPQDREVTEQEDARFETTVAGKPEPTVEW